MTKRYFHLLFCLAGLTLLFFNGCQNERRSVFRAIIEDKAEVDLNLGNELTIIGMTDNGEDYYIAASTGLWKRAVSGNDLENPTQWTAVSMPGNAVYCTAFIKQGTDLYAGFMLADNSCGLYRGILAEDPGWQPITDPEVQGSGLQVTGFFSLQGVLFATVQTIVRTNEQSTTTFSLVYLNGSDFMATGITAITNPVRSMTWDGTYYWAVTKNLIYRSATPTAFTEIPLAPEKPETEAYVALYYSQATATYYLSLTNSLVYAATEPDTAWPQKSEIKKVNDLDVYFTEFAEYDANLMVGTLGRGFYQTKDSDITKLTAHQDELVSDINQSSVIGFYVHPAEDMIFFLTTGAGLYHNTYTKADGWGALTHE